jgi:hypothetical protein
MSKCIPPTRVFLTKSAEVVDSMRVNFLEGAKEFVRVWG